ncbi:MAG: aspartate aminotransferase family protein [Acidimicrobiales bacterium]
MDDVAHRVPTVGPGVHEALLTRRRAVSPDWLATYYEHPIALVDGDGSVVVDAEGRRYLDWFGGILTTVTGHARPEVVEAVRAQAGRLLHSSSLYLSEPAIALAEKVAELSGLDDPKVFFTTSGTEANDAALLLATSFRRSNQVLALRNSYHGRSFSTISVTGHRSWSPSSFSGLSVNYVHGGYRLRSPFRHLDDDAYTAACVEDLRQVLDMTTAGPVACLIAEPIQGVGGVAVPPDGFFGALGDVLASEGILFVADEVQTGWGRTGEHFWGYQAHGVVPDLITFAKGVGNGLALGGVVGRADVMDHLTANSISTFGGNPLAAAGALANLDVIADHDLQGNARARGRELGDGLAALSSGVPWIAEVRGRGLMWAIETVEPGGIVADPERAAALHEACREHGLLVGRGGLYGNVLRIAPMLTATPDEVVDGLGRLRTALTDVADGDIAGRA